MTNDPLTDPLLRLFCHKNYNTHNLQNHDHNEHQNNNTTDEWVQNYRDEILNQHGYRVVSSILSNDECLSAITNIWNFIDETTFGVVQSDDPTTWSKLWSTTSSSMDQQQQQNINHVRNHDYMFQSNGAGYVLSNIYEILADRVYSKLFATNELHTSKEGFYFHPFILQHQYNQSHLDTSYIKQAEVTYDNNSTTISNHVHDTSKVFSHVQDMDTIQPYIRSMVVLDDDDHHRQLVFHCYPNLKHQYLPKNGTTLSLQNFETSNELISVPLRKGDVVLWRSDMIYEISINQQVDISVQLYDQPETQQHCIAAMFCTMQPASCTPNTILSQKMESYRQRQTATYNINKEQWTQSWSHERISPYDRMITQQYYRTSPPLLSIRQAQLFGLLPYQNNTTNDTNFSNNVDNHTNGGIPSLHLNDYQRALIRGVRFMESDIITCEMHFSRRHNIYHRRNEASLVHLSTKDPNDMIGQDKYLGGMASPCGQYIYGVPGSAKRVLRVRVSDGLMDFIGPSFDGKFKWLRGVHISSSQMNHHPLYPHGCCLALPCNATSVLKINPMSNDVYAFGETILQSCGSTRWHYHGGNVAHNGWIYTIPANATRVIKIHPITDEIVYIGPTFIGGQKWFGGIMGSDGCIYGIPHNEQSVLKIDPNTDTVSLLILENGEKLSAGAWKWHGGLRAGHKIYGFPNNANNILVIHCQENRVYTIECNGADRHHPMISSGRHRIPQDDRYKYLGGATTVDERFAYLFPCDAERVLRIDCITDNVCFVGPHLLDGENKFQNGFVGRDGCIYGIPQRASGVLCIRPGSLIDDDSDDDVNILDCGPNLIGVKDKFEGGVLGPDGCIYCIPLRSKVCIKIVPGPPLMM